MSTGYVIPDTSQKQILFVLGDDTNISVTEENDQYIIKMPIEQEYSLKKRLGLAKVLQIAPDNIQQGNNEASVILMKTPDKTNSWFWCNSVSINHPEIVLDRIGELLEQNGFSGYWFSEQDEEYFELSEDNEITKLAKIITEDPNINNCDLI